MGDVHIPRIGIEIRHPAKLKRGKWKNFFLRREFLFFYHKYQYVINNAKRCRLVMCPAGTGGKLRSTPEKGLSRQDVGNMGRTGCPPRRGRALVRLAAGRGHFPFWKRRRPPSAVCCLCGGRRSLPVINSSPGTPPPAWRHDAGGGHGVWSEGAPSPSVRRQKKRAHQGHIPGMQRPCRREKETREWDRIAHEGGEGAHVSGSPQGRAGTCRRHRRKKGRKLPFPADRPHRSVMKGAFLPCRAYGGSGV